MSHISPNPNWGVFSSSARSQHEKFYFFSLFLLSNSTALPFPRRCWVGNEQKASLPKLRAIRASSSWTSECSQAPEHFSWAPGMLSACQGQLAEPLCRWEAQFTTSISTFPSSEHLQWKAGDCHCPQCLAAPQNCSLLLTLVILPLLLLCMDFLTTAMLNLNIPPFLCSKPSDSLSLGFFLVLFLQSALPAIYST